MTPGNPLRADEGTGGVLRPVSRGGAPWEETHQRLLEAPTRQAFARAWLELQLGELEAVRTAVLVLSEGEAFRPVSVWPPGAAVPDDLARAVERTLSSSEATGTVLRGDAEPAGATVVAVPISVADEISGAVAVEFDSGGLAHAAQARRRLTAALGWFEAYELRQRGEQVRSERDRLYGALELFASTLERPGFQRAATTLATELAVRLRCDRVAIGFVQRDRVRLRAVSHTAIFDRRSNLTRATESAMEEALDQESAVYVPRPEGSPFRVDIAHRALARREGAEVVVSLPFGRAGRVHGVLTLQRAEPLTTEELHLCELLGDLAGPVLELERRDALPPWKRLGAALHELWRRLVTPGSGAFKLATLACLSALVVLSLVRGTHRVTADAVLEADRMHVIGAPFTGFLAESPLRPGDAVRVGDLLFAMDARDLELQLEGLRSQEDQTIRRHRQALAEHEASQVSIIRAQLEQVAAEIALVEDRLSRTRVLSPIDGELVEGDLSQALGKPVERGEPLVQVAPHEELRIVLHVPERDVEFLAAGQHGRLVLTTFPSSGIDFTVTRVTPVASIHEETNTFRVEALLDSAGDHLRPGMEGVAKVEVGRRNLVWVWTHDALDWCQLWLWRWSP